MSAKQTFYCDGPECEHHGSSDFPGWLILTDREGPRKHFCNGDCLMKWAASWSRPPIVIQMDGTVEDPEEDERDG